MVRLNARRMFPTLPILLVLFILLPQLAAAGVHERELPLEQAWDLQSPTGAWLAEVTAEPERDRVLAPDLTYWWLLPDGEEIVRVELADLSESVIASLSRAPARVSAIGSEGGETRSTGSAVLWTDSYTLTFTPPRLLHGRVFQGIVLSPLRIEANRLHGLKSARLRITTAAATRPEMIEPLRPDFPLRDRVLATLGDRLLNPESLPVVIDRAVGGDAFPTEVPSVEGAAVDMVIVTVDSFADLCQDYADHKTEFGTATVVRTLEWISERYPHGSDRAETVRNFIKDAYAKWSINYLLIVADSQEIPPRYAYTEIFSTPRTSPTDLYYAGLDGDWNADHDQFWAEAQDSFFGIVGDQADFMAEVHVGRLPASDRADCQVQLAKSRTYHEAQNTPYQDRFLMMGEVLFPTCYPIPPCTTITLHGATACESIYVNTTGPQQHVVRLYEDEWRFDEEVEELTTSSAMDSMSNGFNLILHNGHGFRQTMSVANGSLENGHIATLANGDNTFLLYMINCTAAAVDYNSLAEAFLSNPNGGAFGVIGSTRESFPYVSATYMNEFFGFVSADPSLRLGDYYYKTLSVYTPLAIQDNTHRWFHQTAILLADPSNWLHYESVAELQTDAPAIHNLDAGPVVLTVRDPLDAPVEHAVVCIRKGDEDYQRRVTDAAGQVSFELNPELSGAYQLRVEARDFRPHEDSFTVLVPGSGPWLSVTNVTVDDLTDGEVLGNGNGVAERGETVRLILNVRNNGIEDASSIGGVLRTTHPAVALIDSTESYDTLAPGADSDGVHPFLVEILGAEDDAILDFQLILTCVEGDFADEFFLEAASPLLTIFRTEIDDAAMGDGDGEIEVGEFADVTVSLANYGRGTGQGVTAWIAAPDTSGLVVHQGTDLLGDLAPLSTGLGAVQFNVERVNEDAPVLEFYLTDLFTRTDTLFLHLDRPQGPPGAPSFKPGTDASRLNLVWDTPEEEDAAAYIVLRADEEAGPYQEISEHWVEHASYEDSGLEPYTGYWYKVQTLSAGGLTGPASAPTKATTNPDLMPGWPVTLAAPTTSTPLVADVDGDGDYEIFIGSDRLYGFNPDGTELADGDGDPSTIGPVSPLGVSFATAISAADLTESPGYEVVATAWNSLKVYVFEFELTANGTEAFLVEGWPQSVIHNDGIWTSPSLVDVDGDQIAEIFVTETGSNGALMAWRADGSELIDGDDDPETHGVFYPSMGSWPRSTTAFADIDADHVPEIFVGSTAGFMLGLDAQGDPLPGWPFFTPGGAVFSSPSIGDVDGDEMPEIVFCAENDSLYVLDHDGSRHPGWPVEWVNNNWAWCASVALADLTGDGVPEIFASSLIEREHMQVAWFDSSGAFMPGWPVDVESSSQSSPVVADLDADGDFEVIQANEDGYILAWHHDGTEVEGFPILTGDYIRGTPGVLDIDQDGTMDMILAGWDMSLYIWDFPTGFADDMVPWYTFMHDQRRTGNYAGMDWIVAVDEGVDLPPAAIRLDPVWPNPFNPTAQVRFTIPSGAQQQVRLSIHDAQGRLVKTLVNEKLSPAVYQRSWDGRDDSGRAVSSGVYFARLQMDRQVETRKMTLLK